MFQYNKLTGGKETIYHELQKQVSGLLHDERDWLANTANTAALLYNQLENVNWAGFYFPQGDELVLGPFQGLPACVRLPQGHGVCSAAAERRKTQVVADVTQFPGHIACDSASRSEIVVPIIAGDRLIGVLDIDSPITERFDAIDKRELEKIIATLGTATDWPRTYQNEAPALSE